MKIALMIFSFILIFCIDANSKEKDERLKSIDGVIEIRDGLSYRWIISNRGADSVSVNLSAFGSRNDLFSPPGVILEFEIENESNELKIFQYESAVNSTGDVVIFDAYELSLGPYARFYGPWLEISNLFAMASSVGLDDASNVKRFRVIYETRIGGDGGKEMRFVSDWLTVGKRLREEANVVIRPQNGKR